MKKIIALLTVCVFAVVLAGTVYADSRTPAQKLAAGRDYLKLLDQKIIKHRKLGNAAVVTKLQAEKKGTIKRMKKWKAEALKKAVPKKVAPVAPPPPPPVVVRPAPVAVSEGLFGWGINTGYTVGYLAGNSVIVARTDLILGDALGIGSLLGLSDDAVEWKLGLGGGVGSDINDYTNRKVIPLFVDGLLNLPADLLGGIESYIGGGLNYVLYGSGQTTGSYGGQAYCGIQGDIGLGGKTYAEVAYSWIRSGRSGSDVSVYSMRGVGINVGTQLVL